MNVLSVEQRTTSVLPLPLVTYFDPSVTRGGGKTEVADRERERDDGLKRPMHELKLMMLFPTNKIYTKLYRVRYSSN